MKNVNPVLLAHLKEQVTTLCTCIAIRRQDGKAFYYTDHDEPVAYANQTYVPQDSFSRMSITSSIDMDVDVLEIKGIITSSALNRDEISSGLFDWATINVFVVNWMQPSMGRVMLRTGNLGEVTMDEDGVFTAEVRGLTQVYSVKIGEVYQAECRADLGDRRCTIPLNPVDWAALTHYCAGDIIQAPISPGLGYINLPIVNASFEGDGSVVDVPSLSGWTTIGDTNLGAWGAFNNGADFGNVAHTPYGSYFAGHMNRQDPTTNVVNQSTELGLSQTVSLLAAGITTTDLDTGLCRAVISVSYVRANSDNTAPEMRFAALDGTGNQIGIIVDSGQLGGSEDVWQKWSSTNLIPAGTRSIQINLMSYKKASNMDGSGFDNVQISVNTPSGSLGGASQYGGVAFKATNTGVSGGVMPAFSNLLGSTTVDGSITWLCIKAFSEVGAVTAASPATPAIATVSGLSGGDGYYDGGFLVWESGRNAGRIQEVNTTTGANVQFFIRPFYLPAVGDRFVIHPGCDKTRGTCQSKFDNVINFRGEPDVPGMDEYMKTPNADGSTQFFITAGATTP